MVTGLFQSEAIRKETSIAPNNLKKVISMKGSKTAENGNFSMKNILVKY